MGITLWDGVRSSLSLTAKFRHTSIDFPLSQFQVGPGQASSDQGKAAGVIKVTQVSRNPFLKCVWGCGKGAEGMAARQVALAGALLVS